MTSKVYFDNDFKNYSTELKPIIQNKSGVGISDEFHTKLQNFISTKLLVLTTDMKKNIFCDGTVYTGCAGLALYYFSSCKTISAYEESLQMALQYININNLKGRRISFLCGDAGPLALAIVISYKLGPNRPDNLPDYKILIQRLMNLISVLDDSPDELLYGKAGYLYALLFVNKYISVKDTIPSSHIEKVVEAIFESGKQFSKKMKSDCPLLWQWHDKVYFGAAHGMAGILFMLLQAREYINAADIRSFIKPSLDWLLSQQYASGNFPSSLNSSSHDRLVQWCHGAPGFVPLCLLAYQIFEEDKYLKIALQCGEVVWQRGLCKKGFSICHGVAGNAYTFVQLYQVTKEPKHLYRACCFTKWCILERSGTQRHHPDRPASLFEGLVGSINLAEDLKNINEARFPGFCL
ncbi:hypothetical protein ACJJTC_018719 [Scirpophaga incertulas]